MVMKRLIFILLAVSLLALHVNAQRAWEEVDTLTLTIDHSGDNDFVDVNVKDGYVYITTSRPVTVKIFSILGQLIAQKDIQAGTHRVRLTARGIYVLKIGSVTKRITI